MILHEALRADNRLALPHVGLSYALAERGDAVGARASASRTQSLQESLSARERVRVEPRTRRSDILANRALAAMRLPAQAAEVGNRALKQKGDAAARSRIFGTFYAQGLLAEYRGERVAAPEASPLHPLRLGYLHWLPRGPLPPQ